MGTRQPSRQVGEEAGWLVSLLADSQIPHGEGGGKRKGGNEGDNKQGEKTQKKSKTKRIFMKRLATFCLRWPMWRATRAQTQR